MYREVYDGIVWFKILECLRFFYYGEYNFMLVCLLSLSYVEIWNE